MATSTSRPLTNDSPYFSKGERRSEKVEGCLKQSPKEVRVSRVSRNVMTAISDDQLAPPSTFGNTTPTIAEMEGSGRDSSSL